MAMIPHEIEHVMRHAHLYCGIGGGGQGFNEAAPRVGNIVGKWVCAGGIDSDAGAIRQFEKKTGARGTVRDLFSREQYMDFHGHEPPFGWSEAAPADIYAAFGPAIDCLFLSAPCKGFSGLLSNTKSKTDKYQALNRLTLRGIWLTMEAYKDEPISVILFENVPRIMTRGRGLLDQIFAILRTYGYLINEDTHDCGELGNLAQSRKRFLALARHPSKIPPFIYQPPKFKLRGVGEVIGKLPLPGDPVAGIMHRVPELQWRTWVRLAFVPAGKDWRALNELAVEDGFLRDFGIVPEHPLRDNALGVCAWSDRAPLLTGARSPLQGRFSVADPRPDKPMFRSSLGVTAWPGQAPTIGGRGFPLNGAYAVADIRTNQMQNGSLGVMPYLSASYCIPGETMPTNGPFAVADVRPAYGMSTHRNVLGVIPWAGSAYTIRCSMKPSGGAHAIADVRVDGHPKSVQLGVRGWLQSAACIKTDMSVGTGPYAIADIRMLGRPRFNNTFRIVALESHAPAVQGPGGPGGGLAVADMRPPAGDYSSRKYKVHRMDDTSRAVIAASTTGDGAYAIADPRGGEDPSKLHGKYHVNGWGFSAHAVIGGRDQGAFAVADPRCTWGKGRHEAVLRVTGYSSPVGTVPGAVHSVTGGQPIVADQRRENYQTGGHYGVVPWGGVAYAVPGFAKFDRGWWSVADPRDVGMEEAPSALPAPDQRLVCRIIALDETWHRPFTTLELASLQSLVDPEEVFGLDEDGRWFAKLPFEMEASSDAMKREWIGNAVPPAAAKAMATTIGEAIILASIGETFQLSTRDIWVKPGALALAIDNDQYAYRLEAGLA